MLKKYVKTKPIQAILMLIVLAWSVYEIGAISTASNASLTKEFMHSHYVMVRSSSIIMQKNGLRLP